MLRAEARGHWKNRGLQGVRAPQTDGVTDPSREDSDFDLSPNPRGSY